MSALNTAFARTSAGETELAHASLGLSLIQRKLLALVSAERPLNQIHLNHVLHEDEVERSIARLLELGLIMSADLAASPPPLRLGEPPRKSFSPVLPIVVTVVVLAGAGIWLMNRHQGVRPPPTAAAATNAVEEIADASPTNSPSPDIKEEVSAVPAIVPAPTKTSDSPARRNVDSAKPAVKPGSQATAAAKDSAKPIAPQAAPSAAASLALIDESKTNAKTPVARTEPPEPDPVAEPAAPQPGADTAPIDIAPAQPAAVAAAQPATVAAATIAETPPPPTPAQAVAKVIYREAPNFPPEAVIQGVTSGNVKVRLNIDSNGAVTNVTIVESRPRKLFDKAVLRALNRWKFEPTGGPQIVETEVVFTVANE